jgi:hypothetical protein
MKPMVHMYIFGAVFGQEFRLTINRMLGWLNHFLLPVSRATTRSPHHRNLYVPRHRQIIPGLENVRLLYVSFVHSSLFNGFRLLANRLRHPYWYGVKKGNKWFLARSFSLCWKQSLILCQR